MPLNSDIVVRSSALAFERGRRKRENAPNLHPIQLLGHRKMSRGHSTMREFAGGWNSPQRAGSKWRRRGPGQRVCFYGGGRCGRPVYTGFLLERAGVYVRREGARGNRRTCPIRIFKFLMSFCRLSRSLFAFIKIFNILATLYNSAPPS